MVLQQADDVWYAVNIDVWRMEWGNTGCYCNFQDLDFKHRGVLFSQIFKNSMISKQFRKTCNDNELSEKSEHGRS